MPQSPRLSSRIILLFPIFAAGISLVSCEKHLPDRVEITQKRAPLEGDDKVPGSVTSAMRFMDGLPRLLKWKTPPGWKLLPAQEFRDLNFSVGPNGIGDCYISQLNGDASSPLANVNRWRKQMGQPPSTEDELADLPRLKFFMQEGLFVDLTGSYQAAMMMDGETAPPPEPGYRLLAVYVPFVQGAVTVKMTGPADLVAAEKANFEAFCASVEINREMLE